MLKVTGINTYYGQSHILHDVTLSVPEGQVVSILGRNGAGKTTAVLTIMGYIKPKRGHIVYRDRDLIPLSPFRHARAGLGFVPQERCVFRSLTVEENLQVAECRRKGRWHLKSLYQLFPRLEERRRNMGSQLSGGEQQMLSIARALMGNPSLLLMDEPSEGLAPMIVEEILQVIRQIKADGTAVLLVEQNMRVALSVSEYCYVLEKGSVQLSAPANELMAQTELLRTHLSV